MRLFEIWSNPEELLGARPLITSIISSSVTSLNEKESFGCGAFRISSAAEIKVFDIH